MTIEDLGTINGRIRDFQAPESIQEDPKNGRIRDIRASDGSSNDPIRRAVSGRQWGASNSATVIGSPGQDARGETIQPAKEPKLTIEGIASINGEISPIQDARISILDHLTLYGDGVFEGIRFTEHGILFHEEHRERLFTSARSLRMNQVGDGDEAITREQYDEQLFRAIRESGLRSGYIRAIFSRGIGDLGISPAGCKHSKIIFLIAKLRLYPEELYELGIATTIASTRKIPIDAFDCGIKSCNYLNNIMASWEYIDRGAKEAIMLTGDGLVSEATVENIFCIHNGTISTPGLDSNCLGGITRAKIIEIARDLGIPFIEGNITQRALITADEIFLTGTGAGVIPVSSIDAYKIGSGGMGPISRQIREAYERRLPDFCTPIAP